MENVLKNISQKQMAIKRRNLSLQQDSLDKLNEEAAKKLHKDDWELLKSDENYVEFNYWKLPDQYKIDELMEDMNKPTE